MLILKLMEEIEFFSEFTPYERKIVADDNSFFEHYNSGDHIIHEGDDKDCSLYILLKGSVAITKKNYLRKVITVMGEGDILGEASFLTCQPRTASAIAQDSVTVFRIDGNSIQNLDCQLQLKIKDQLIQILLYRLTKTNNALASLLT